jgi:O-antigen/teichoic acid export membrane protein
MSQRRVLISTLSQIAGRVGGLAIALISTKLLASYLGPAGMGDYNTVLAIAGFAVIIGDLGLFSTVVRELAKHPHDQARIARTVFSLRLWTALGLSLVFAGIALLLPVSPTFTTGLVIISAYVFWNLFGSFYDMILQLKLQMQISAVAELLSKIVAVGAIAVIVYADLGVAGAVLAYTLSAAAAAVLKYTLSRKYMFGAAAYDAILARNLLIAALPLGAIYLVNNLFFRMDTLLLRGIQGAEVTGWYTTAYRLLEVTLFVGTFFSSSLKPILAENIDNDPAKVGSVVSKGLGYMITAVIPITLLSSLYARDIILLLSDDRFLPGVPALIILSCTLPFIYFDALLGEVLVAKDLRKTLLRVAITMVVLNLSLNLVLIPSISLIGAALATLLTEIVLFTINTRLVRALIPLKFPWHALGLSLAAGIILTSIAVVTAPLPTALSAILGFLGYIAAAHRFGIIPKIR